MTATVTFSLFFFFFFYFFLFFFLFVVVRLGLLANSPCCSGSFGCIPKYRGQQTQWQISGEGWKKSFKLGEYARGRAPHPKTFWRTTSKMWEVMLWLGQCSQIRYVVVVHQKVGLVWWNWLWNTFGILVLINLNGIVVLFIVVVVSSMLLLFGISRLMCCWSHPHLLEVRVHSFM